MFPSSMHREAEAETQESALGHTVQGRGLGSIQAVCRVLGCRTLAASTRTCVSLRFWRLEVQGQGSSRAGFSEAFPLARRRLCPLCVLPSLCVCASLCGLGPLSYRPTGHIVLTPTNAPLNLITSLKVLCPNTVMF